MSEQLIYVKGDLLKTKGLGGYVVHACNCQGVWGAGFAAQLKAVCPYAFDYYKKAVSYYKPGRIIVSPKPITEPHQVVCLLTSKGYGKNKDDVETIKIQTTTAVLDLFREIDLGYLVEVHSPKINAGLFGVPWEDTERILLNLLSRFSNIKWYVYEL